MPPSASLRRVSRRGSNCRREHVRHVLEGDRHRDGQRGGWRAPRCVRIRRRGQQHARAHRGPGPTGNSDPAIVRSWPPCRSRSIASGCDRPAGAFGRLAEASAGKDSVTGHWEMMGVVLEKPFPVFPNGFPCEVIELFEETGRATLWEQDGVRHGRSSRSSGPSTCGRGAHRLHVGRQCVPDRGARGHRPRRRAVSRVRARVPAGRRGMGVGRVIARPFVGRPGSFKRTANRRDYALPPVGETLLDLVKAAGWPVAAVGKIEDLFAGRGFTVHAPHGQRPGGHGSRRAVDGASRSRADIREPGGFRHGVRPPKRRGGIMPQISNGLIAVWRRSCQGFATRISWSSQPTTATIRRRRRPITRASTCRSSSWGLACGLGSISGRGEHLPTLDRRWRNCSGFGRSRAARAFRGDHRLIPLNRA